MVRRHAEVALQVAALVGLAVSAFLLAEYRLPPGAGACGPGGGCASVRECAATKLAGLPFPLLGVLAFGTLLVLSMASDGRVRRALPYLGLGAGAAGFALVVIQKLVCRAWCPFCLVTDGAAIACGAFAWLGRAEPSAATPVRRVVVGVLALASVIGTGVLSDRRAAVPPVEPHRVATLPEPIAREQREGVATIVEFADFECPYCRRQHAEITAALASYGPRVRFVRKHVPLRFHEHAEVAARAACCAEEQGRAEPMADALFRAEDLSLAGCERIARRLDLDVGAWQACLNAPRTTARLDRDREDANRAEVSGLPTMFVGRERFEGVVPAATLRASIDRALSASASQGADASRPRS